MTRTRRAPVSPVLAFTLPSLVAAIALGHAPDARACSFTPGVSQRLVVPADQATAVPINARVALIYTASPSSPRTLLDGLAEVKLRKVGDTALVPAAITRGVGGSPDRFVVYVAPTQPLLADTAYEVLTKVKGQGCFDSCLAADDQVISHFTTSAVSDDVAPSFTGSETLVPGVRVTSVANEPCFSDYVTFRLARGGATDTSTLLFDVYRDTELVASAQPAADIQGAVRCGAGSQGPFSAAFSALSGSYHVRAVDLAGNQDVGGPGIALPDLCATVKRPDSPGDDEGGGCDVAAGGRGAGGLSVLLAGGLLALLVARRGYFRKARS